MRDSGFGIYNLRVAGSFPRLLIVVALWLLVVGCGKKENVVVVYTSQDQVYAEPVLKRFTKETGIEVRAVYDNEAVKTVGLVNRLMAEKDHPQCDVFWNNEELRTRQLAAKNLFRETNGWAAFGYRSRRIAFSDIDDGTSFLSLTNESFRGKVALAYPLFGTTATHFMALRQHWGAERWQEWCRALVANKPMLVDGNSVVVKLVVKGEVMMGLTDSDDITAAQREGSNIVPGGVYPEMLMIPNTVGVLRNAPHPDAAQQLFTFLLGESVRTELVAVNALEGAVPPDTQKLEVDWDKLLAEIDIATTELKEIFLR